MADGGRHLARCVLKVFLDTNVWLSATVFSGLCEAILVESAQRGWLVSTTLVREEAHLVLKRKFPNLPNAPILFDAVWAQAEVIADESEPVNDNDKRLVRAASQAGVAVFVTGDRRVLGWGQMQDMKILNPRDAWNLLYVSS